MARHLHRTAVFATACAAFAVVTTPAAAQVPSGHVDAGIALDWPAIRAANRLRRGGDAGTFERAVSRFQVAGG